MTPVDTPQQGGSLNRRSLNVHTRIFAVAVLAATLSFPVSHSAQAGFWTDVAKGSIKNSLRHAKQSAKKAKDTAAMAGRGAACLAARVVGRCQ